MERIKHIRGKKSHIIRTNKIKENSSAPKTKKQTKSRSKKITKISQHSPTKNLVLQAKTLFKLAANQMDISIKQNINKLLKQNTNLMVLKLCLQNVIFKSKMIQMHQKGKLIEKLFKGRMKFCNLATFLIYYNRLLNGIQNPKYLVQGIWTVPVNTIAQPNVQRESRCCYISEDVFCKNKQSELSSVQQQQFHRRQYQKAETNQDFVDTLQKQQQQQRMLDHNKIMIF